MTTLLVLALAAAIWLVRRGRSIERRRRVAGWIAVLTVIALAVAMAPSVLVLRKLVGFVLMPTTLVWLGLVALVVRSWPDRRWRRPLLVMLVAYSIAGNAWTAYLLLGSLERPYENAHPLASTTHYDAVIVLGGGTSWLPHGHNLDTQLGASGDRVRLAAALYTRGRTPTLVTSGSSVDGDRDISEETASLLRQLGVPDSAIVRLWRPLNSSGEIEAYARLVEERKWQHVAVVTSARHLPRVLALCRRRGLTADPLPTDFRGEMPPLELLTIVPNGGGFADVEQAAWEYVGLAAVHLVGG